MNATPELAPDSAPESTTIATLVADCVAASSSSVKTTTELAFAEAKLAAISLTLMVLMGVLSALFVLGAWGLVIAAFVAALLELGASLWLVLAALGLLHVLGAWLL